MARANWTDEKILDRLKNNLSDKTRLDNIRILRSRPSSELFNKCVEYISSNNEKIKLIGIDVLAQLGARPRPFLKETLKLYFDLLDKVSEPSVLESLFYAIGHNNDNLNKTQIKALCSFSENEKGFVKESLVFALLGIDDLKAVETLIKLSSDKSTHVRNWATFGIGTLIETDTNEVRKALLERTNDRHQETKFEAILGLAKRKDNTVNEIIKQELIKGEFSTLLFDAIIETKNPFFLPLLQQNLNSTKDNQDVNPDWITDLEDCIKKLSEFKE